LVRSGEDDTVARPSLNDQEFPAMPRVRGIEDDGGDPILKPIFDKQRELFGDLLNPAKVMAHCPPILRTAAVMGQAFEQSGQLPKSLLPLVYLRVASINGCPF
jgi:alkylhydroperoxidase family enzyme